MGKPATRNRPWGILPGSRLETGRIQEKLSLSVSLLRNHGQASNPKSTLGGILPGSRLETARIQEKLSLSTYQDREHV